MHFHEIGLEYNKTLNSDKMSLHHLPSDPNIRKEWENFIFNEDPDRVSKNLVLCTLHLTGQKIGYYF